MYKQAYLIIAHKYDETFKTLLRMIDREENDIYIHMDRKNKQYNENECKNLIKKSNIFFIKRCSVAWGGYSQINVELMLLKLATKNKYNYYHLLSGQDLPIQSSETIKKFFIDNQGYEFVGFDKVNFEDNVRVSYYYPLQEIIGRNRDTFIGRIAALITLIQKCIHLKRNKMINFQKGPNWFSITNDLAQYVVKKENWIKKVFSNTVCCDEVFLQTVVINSPFKHKLYQKEIVMDTETSIMRLVDWKRGGPYIFQSEDYQEILSSKMIFARKFDTSKDEEIVKHIYELYGKSNEYEKEVSEF